MSTYKGHCINIVSVISNKILSSTIPLLVVKRRKHTKEEFDHIISVHDDDAEYVKVNEIENGQVTLAYEYIEKLYQRCLEKNSFLVVRPDDEDGEE